MHAGEIVALIGPNGAGRTTAFNMISGAVVPSVGTVTMAGQRVEGRKPHVIARAGATRTFQNLQIFASSTALGNVLGAYTRRRRPAAERDADRDRALTLFPRLADRLSQAAGTLSCGEQQMLAIARGLMARPRVLVLDEPSVGLAPRLVGEIFTALGALRDDGLTLLLVEQNARAAFAVADRAYVMDRGQVVMDGEPAALLDDPRVQAAYLGGGFTDDAPAQDGDPHRSQGAGTSRP